MSKGRRGGDKDMNLLITEAEKIGWTVSVTGGGHLKFKRGKHSLFASKTASDHRSIKNFRAVLRRANQDVGNHHGR